MFDMAGVLLLLAHFTVPVGYFLYVKKCQMKRGWDLRIDINYRPNIAIVIPTYNEEKIIEQKLDNVYVQDYPKDKITLIVVDSASQDRTVDKVRKWMLNKPGMPIMIIEEHTRRGLNPALNYALRHIPDSVEIVIFTDADSFWRTDALGNVIKYFADPQVGAVTTKIEYLEEGKLGIENAYRSFYNIVREGESKCYSTPVHNGALVAYRLSLLKKIGGVPEFTGNNDSTPASIIAFMGYRSIQIGDTVVFEPLREKQWMRRVRRAQHLILGFLKTKDYVKRLGLYKKTPFEFIWNIEWWLHIVNPWLLVFSVPLLLLGVLVQGSSVALSLILLGLGMFLVKPYRVWIFNQITLVVALIRNLWTRDLIWKK